MFAKFPLRATQARRRLLHHHHGTLETLSISPMRFVRLPQSSRTTARRSRPICPPRWPQWPRMDMGLRVKLHSNHHHSSWRLLLLVPRRYYDSSMKTRMYWLDCDRRRLQSKYTFLHKRETEIWAICCYCLFPSYPTPYLIYLRRISRQ